MIDLEKIKKLRKEKGIKMGDIAKELGYKYYQSYYRIENGKRKPSLDKLFKISEILNISIEELIKKGEEDER
uniref:XRE family transcriptional regulator n=1 Tax=Dictyoglomus thermophilum TaxID=14 RepID=A0A7V4DXW1_DICTH